MGFFSWDCPGCKHSIRHSHAVNDDSAWLSEAVLVEPDGSTARGLYDGYGRLEMRSGRSIELGDSPLLYHEACYDLTGKPSYAKPSRSAWDQGHFVGEYDPKKPASRADVAALAAKSDADREARRKEREAEGFARQAVPK
jgi:hypothetical protein